MKEIILSTHIRKVLDDIDARYTKGMKFIYVTEMIEVVNTPYSRRKCRTR